MSVLPRDRAVDRLALSIVLAIVALLVSTGAGPAPTGAPPATVRALVDSDPCSGAILPHNYSGTVRVYHSASAPVVALAYSYEAVVVTNRTDGVVLSTVCASENATITSNPNGSFALAIDPTPAVNCTIPPGGASGQCVTVRGPYASVHVAPTSAAPAGYFSSVTENGTAFAVEYYPWLASVRLDPGGPAATFSPQGKDEFRALPLTGAGTPTPGAPRFDWTLSGTGWTFVDPASGPRVNVSAASGAGIGNLTVSASLAVSGTSLAAPPTSVELLAVATSISSASLNRSVVDVGEPVGAEVDGTGAAGYAYTATLLPGLAESGETAPCSSSPEVGGTVALGCTITWNYTTAGVAQPVVTVSNGFSSAVWSFPDVPVAPAPSLSFLPVAPVGYSNATIPITVAAALGTGSAPFAEGCLASGVGPVECLRSPGPTWTYAPTYASPGAFSAVAWAIDATGANRSVTTTVRVVGPLGVAFAGNGTSGAVGAPLTLVALLAGGDLPAEAWWNISGVANPVEVASVTADGPVTATYVPSSSGFVTVSVAVVDRLGTGVRASRTFAIGVGAATSVVPVALSPGVSTRAGTPFAMSWQALDLAGEVVPDFASAAEIELEVAGSARAAPGWVNASGFGPLATPLPGWFDVPSTGWVGGVLSVTVTSRVAGPIQVALRVASGLPTVGAAVGVAVLPDIDHLRLFAPRTFFADGRSNDTLWQVTDRFGNAAYGAVVVITASFGGSSVSTDVPALVAPGGGTEVWTNLTVPGSAAGTVTVTDLAGDELLPPIVVAGPASPWTALSAPLALALAGGAGGMVGAMAYLRGRSRRTRRAVPPGDDEAGLQRLAEGRAAVIEMVRRAGSVDLTGLAAAWAPPPAPPDLADWLASLLTDGTLDATFGADGVARFCVPTRARRDPGVTLDVAVFDRAQLRREAEAAEWGHDDR